MNRTDMYNQMYARGDEVSSGRRPGTTGPNVQRNMPDRMTRVAEKVLTGSGRPPVGTMATPKPGSLTLPAKTLSRMRGLASLGKPGLIAAGGLGLFEIGRQGGFSPENLGRNAAKVGKFYGDLLDEAADVARELGQPIQDFVGRVVQGYQSEMGGSERLERMMMGGQGRTISNMDRDRVRIDIPRTLDQMREEDIQMRNLMQQQQLGFAAGDEVDVDALPKGLKAMYDSGPKGREGVEKIAAKTDKFAEGGAVESEIDKALEEIQGAAPDAMVIQQVMTMVMEMIQSGASEEQIVAALKEMGLDEEDIQQVMMMIAEQMQGQDPIQSQLSQMM